jgi:hypothetical protein
MSFGGKDQESPAAVSKSKEQEAPLFRDRNGVVTPARKKTRAEIDTLETVRVSGIVRLVGSSIRTELVISGADGEWHIEPKDREKFLNLQQRMVVAEGKVDVEEFPLTGSSRMIRQYTLRNAVLIEVFPDK